ncbi:MAG: hypothetical protein AAF940_10665 [Pseudomonadota bacterium]
MPNRKTFQLVTLSCLIATLWGCSTLNPAGLVAASRLDPLNTAPSQIAVAVGVPSALRLDDGDAEIRMAFRGGTDAAPVFLEEAAPLQLSQSTGNGPVPNAAGERVYIARIAEEDADAIAQLQSEIRAYRASGRRGQGSLTIGLVGGCYEEALPGAIKVSTWLQTDPDNRFVPLTNRSDVARSLGEPAAAQLRAKLRPCDA